MKTRIANASVVFPSEVVRVDVLIDGTRIADIDAAPQITVDEVIDATGLHLLPGVIDDQVHFREPGLTHKEDLAFATRACAKGGVTTFLEMPNTAPATISQQAIDDKLHRASRKSLVNFGFYIGATPRNLASLQTAKRTPGIKIFIGSSTGDLLVDEQDILERIFSETTLPICAHCEDESTVRTNAARFGDSNDVSNHSRIRDHNAAIIATQRAVDLANRHRHRFHVLHVSTADEAAYLRDLLQKKEKFVTSEVCPHHLLFTTDDYPRLGARVQMNPSVKTADDNEALWAALRKEIIQVIATDHAPHTLDEKRQLYPRSPSGMPAVENSLALMLDAVNGGRLTLQHVARAMSDAPARVWDIVGKGRIAVGFDADLVLVDMNRETTIRDEKQWTKCGWTSWHGASLQGLPLRTWVLGHEVYRDGRIVAQRCGRPATFDHARGGYWATCD